MVNVSIAVAVLLLALVVAIGTRPQTFRVERSALIEAPPNAIFPYVNDFHRWNRWSPFEKLDPNLQRTFSGAASGVGTTYRWAGNRQAGEGSMTITQSVPDERIVLDLAFLKPFKATNVTEFTFVPASGGTTVTWTMTGANTLPGKLISLVSSMDRMVGGSFAEGLANLKALAETEGRT